jgi:uncharacterized Rmd1/YagE family protein
MASADATDLREQTLLGAPLVAAGGRLRASAIFVGDRIDARALQPRLGEHPVLTTVREGGWAAVFRYGAVVFFGVPEEGRRRFLGVLGEGIEGRFDEPEREVAEITVDPERRDGVYDNVISVQEANAERLQVIAEILAKSVVLAHYEEAVADVFEMIEPLAEELKATGKTVRKSRELLRQIGDTLLIQHRMVGRVEVSEKPELLWERPDLERLYLRMEDEFEIGDRHLAIERKLTLISDTNETLLEMLQTRQFLRVEWYIVILIVIEIVIYLYDLFVH